MGYGYSQIVDWIVRRVGQREEYVNIKASVWGCGICLGSASMSDRNRFDRKLDWVRSLSLSLFLYIIFVSFYLLLFDLLPLLLAQFSIKVQK